MSSEDIEEIIEKLFEEGLSSAYPDTRATIRERYKDVSQNIFKKWYNGGTHRGSFLSFGSRRSSMISNYGNTPVVIRRSFSSNGMLEYVSEQYSSLKFKNESKLPSITQEETGSTESNMVKNTQSNSSVHSESNESSLSTSQSLETILEEKDKLKNRKIFTHYDFPVSRKISNDANQKKEKVISTISEDAELQSKKNIINLGNSSIINSHDIVSSGRIDNNSRNSQILSNGENFECDIKDSVEYPNEHVNNLPKVENNSNESSFQRRSSGSYRVSSSVSNDDQSLGKGKPDALPRRSINRNSLRGLPRRSPTPPRKHSRKSKLLREKSNSALKDDASRIGSGEFSKPSPVPKTIEFPPLVNIQNKEVDNLDDEHLSTVLRIVEEGDPAEIDVLAANGAVNKNAKMSHSRNNRNAIGLAPLSPVKTSSNDNIHTSTPTSDKTNLFSNKVEPSFSASFLKYNRVVSTTSPDGLLESTFIQRPSLSELNMNKLCPKKGYKFSKAQIKSYPYESSYNQNFNYPGSNRCSNEQQFSNGSKMCVVM